MQRYADISCKLLLLLKGGPATHDTAGNDVSMPESV